MAKFGEWIPVKWRPLDEEEREFYYEDITCIACFETPDDGDEILISRNNGEWVDLVVFCNNEFGIGDEDGNDWLDEVEAWMPLPEGYKKEDK